MRPEIEYTDELMWKLTPSTGYSVFLRELETFLRFVPLREMCCSFRTCRISPTQPTRCSPTSRTANARSSLPMDMAGSLSAAGSRLRSGRL